jgi:hypothetical protein
MTKDRLPDLLAVLMFTLVLGVVLFTQWSISEDANHLICVWKSVFSRKGAMFHYHICRVHIYGIIYCIL